MQTEHRLTLTFFGDEEQAREFADEIAQEFGTEVSVEKQKENGDMEWTYTAGEDNV